MCGFMLRSTFLAVKNAFVDLQFQTGSYISNLKVPVCSFA